jgi:hypothetical protein
MMKRKGHPGRLASLANGLSSPSAALFFFSALFAPFVTVFSAYLSLTGATNPSS